MTLIPRNSTIPTDYRHRVITKLSWASTCDPVFAEGQKLKGNRAKGKTYERSVIRRIKKSLKNSPTHSVVAGQWYSFVDTNGKGHCQTDCEIHTPSCIILLECKLTQKIYAERQMKELYLPILTHLYPGKPIYLVQTAKNLTSYHPYLIRDLCELQGQPTNRIYLWHFIP